MCKNQFIRKTDKNLTRILNKFIEETEKYSSSSIGSKSYSYYNQFIFESFNNPPEKRYSISQLSIALKKTNIESKDISYLLTRYIDGLYMLAQLKNKIQGFYP